MKIFLSGSEGSVGKYFSEMLTRSRVAFIGFDKKNGRDLLDPSRIWSSISGCDVVLHLAVATGESEPNSPNPLGENLKGLFNLLTAAESNSIKKFVFMSSVDVLGIFKGEAPPKYFPIDDEHPCAPSTEYGIGKLLGEEMCKAWSLRTGIQSVSLRPPGIWFPGTYDMISNLRKERTSYEWDPYWEYGAFIDVRDLFEVSLKALQANQGKVFDHYLVCAKDITTSGRTSLELAEILHPGISWKSREKYEDAPYQSILNCENAMSDLGWTPEYSWSRYLRQQ